MDMYLQGFCATVVGRMMALAVSRTVAVFVRTVIDGVARTL